MTKKKRPSLPPQLSSLRRFLSSVRNLLILLSFSLSLLALLCLHRSLSLSSSSLSRRSRTPTTDLRGPPKVAFLFLARRNLPLDFLWGNFFEVLRRFLHNFCQLKLLRGIYLVILFWGFKRGVEIRRRLMWLISRYMYTRSLVSCSTNRVRGRSSSFIGS